MAGEILVKEALVSLRVHFGQRLLLCPPINYGGANFVAGFRLA